MKRSGPPKRRKPLTADPDKQREWERRSRRQLKRNPPSKTAVRKAPNAGTPRLVPPKRKPLPSESPIYRAACAAVDRRSGGWCEAKISEACPAGRHRAQHHHHVILRGQGGPDADWNLLHVCVRAHRWIHDHPAISYERGLLRRARAV